MANIPQNLASGTIHSYSGTSMYRASVQLYDAFGRALLPLSEDGEDVSLPEVSDLDLLAVLAKVPTTRIDLEL